MFIAQKSGVRPASAPWGVQRKCACGGKCAECRKVQRYASNQTGPAVAPPILHDALRSPGQPLDAKSRAFFEPRFDHDFGKVRVHTGSLAAESANAVEAHAYTVGRDVVFGAAQYAPETPRGRQLLAHELAHVVQQSGTAGSPSALRVGESDSPAERDADQAASAVVADRAGARPASSAEPSIQRQAAPPASSCGPQGRSLTPGERSAAEFVFGKSLNLDPICIKENAAMAVGGYVRTLPDTIYVAPGTKDTIGVPLLIHELTHCAQYQHGVSRVVTAAYAIQAHYDYGGEQGLLNAITAKKCFTAFNTEQQADIVRDYYVKAASNESTHPWSVFVNQVRAQGACVWPAQQAPTPTPPKPAPGTA